MARISARKKRIISARKKSRPENDWAVMLRTWKAALDEHQHITNALMAGYAFYDAIASVAALYEEHEKRWSFYLRQHGISPHPRKPFRPLLEFLMVGAGPSWITKVTAVLDEWRDSLRHDDVSAAGLRDYLSRSGGVQAIYDKRRGVEPPVRPDEARRGQHIGIPPEIHAETVRRYGPGFVDQCPYPLTEGFNALSPDHHFAKKNELNPPFRRQDNIDGKPLTAWFHKTIAEHEAGYAETTVIYTRVPSWVNLALQWGATIEPLGRVGWIDLATGKRQPSPDSAARFVFQGKGGRPSASNNNEQQMKALQDRVDFLEGERDRLENELAPFRLPELMVTMSDGTVHHARIIDGHIVIAEDEKEQG
jgi:hypothetical protein